MEAIQTLFNQDIAALVIGIFIVMSGIIAMFNIIGKFSEIIGRPLKWVQRKNQDHELLIATSTKLNALQDKHEEDVRQSISHDKEIKEDLEILKKMFIDKEIDDLRWEILDFASAISAGRKYSKEQFDHVLSIYEKYEGILEKHGLSNGQVTTSMEVINEVYKEKLKNGF